MAKTKIRVLALDLDGTLTNDQKIVPPRTRAALDAAAAAGVCRAVRLRAVRRRGAKRFAPAPYGGGCAAHDAHIPFLTHDCSRNEYGALTDAADARALGGVAGDAGGIYFIFFQFRRYCQDRSPADILP